MSEPTIRAMRPEDAPVLATMKREIFGPRRASEASWRHKYFGHPWPGPAGVVVERAGEIVGTVGETRRPLSLDGVPLMAGLNCDLMLDPSVRGLGLRPRMIGRFVEEFYASGGHLHYSFPNRRSEPRKSWRDKVEFWGGEIASVRRTPFRVPFYARVLDARAAEQGFLRQGDHSRLLRAALRLGCAVAARSPSLPAGSGFSVVLSGRLPSEVAGLASAPSPARFHIRRTEEYLRWRYDDDPEIEYRFLLAEHSSRPAGVMVLAQEVFTGIDTLFVVDWLLEHRDSKGFEAMLREAVAEGRRRGAALVVLAALAPFGRRAVLQGFCPLPDWLNPSRMLFTFWIPPWLPDGVSARDLAQRRNWFLTMGDSDVF